MTPELQRIADSWETSLGDPTGLTAIERAEGEFAVREQRIDLTPAAARLERFHHGDWRLGEVDGADPATIARLARDEACLLYTSPSPRDRTRSRMPSSA